VALASGGVLAQQKTFVLRGASSQFGRRDTDVGVFFSSMRFNRASNVWNFESEPDQTTQRGG